MVFNVKTGWLEAIDSIERLDPKIDIFFYLHLLPPPIPTMDTDNYTPKTDLDLDLELFFSLSHDFLCIAGFDGYFRKINPAFINLMGYTEEELFSHPVRHFVHSLDKVKTAAFVTCFICANK